MTPRLARAVATLRAEARRVTREAEHLRDRVAALEVVIGRATESASEMMWRGVALTALQVEHALPRVDQTTVHRAVHDEIITAVYEEQERLRGQRTEERG